MTSDKIQALRKTHKNDGDGDCDDCWKSYPCDVITVLDAYEAERKLIIDAISHGHHEMYEIINEIAKIIGQS